MIYESPRFPQSGSNIRADWGKKLVESIRQRSIIPQAGQRVLKTSYGTIIETEKKESNEDWTIVQDAAFRVRWYEFEKGRGEWQICLPIGCASVKGEIEENYVPVNAKSKDSEGNDLIKWYSIPTPSDESADITRSGKYYAKSWSVRILFKPWPRMKVITTKEDKDFGYTKWSETVATIFEIVYPNRTGHSVINYQPENGRISYSREMGSFAIRYEVNENGSATPYVINQEKIIGRLQLSNVEPKNIENAKSVWIKYLHPDTTMKMSVEKDLSGQAAISNDDSTVFQIYTMKDNVVVTDYRSTIPEMNFYTNAPETPEK